MHISNQPVWGDSGSHVLFSALGFCQLLSVRKSKNNPKCIFLCSSWPQLLCPFHIKSDPAVKQSWTSFSLFLDHSWAEAELITPETVFPGWLQTKNAISQRSAEASETRLCCTLEQSWGALNAEECPRCLLPLAASPILLLGGRALICAVRSVGSDGPRVSSFLLLNLA